MKKLMILITLFPLLFSSFVLAQSPPRKDSELLKRGKALYQEYCTQCHGAKGDGKGSVGLALKTPPADFTMPFEKWKFSEGNLKRVFEAITNGIPGAPMPKLRLSDEERWALTYAVVEFAGSSVKAPKAKTQTKDRKQSFLLRMSGFALDFRQRS